MSNANATAKLAIANKAFLSVGSSPIDDLTNENSTNAIKVSSIFEEVVKELLADDWTFSRKRVNVDDLTQVYKLTVDTAPSPSGFVIGKTITGQTSNVTCTVLDRLSNTVYLVTEPSGDFTDGETLQDDADTPNSVDCASGYPLSTEDLDIGGWSYGFVMPTDQLFIRGLGAEDYDKVKYPHRREGKIFYCNLDDAYWHYNRWLGEDEDADTSDVTLMPMWFRRLISARIAQILSPNITENQRIRTKVEREYDEAWLEAREQNGLETYNENEQGNTDWRDGANRELQSI